jgi:hypothetical protein
LIGRKIFFNIPAQKFFGPVQSMITRHHAVCKYWLRGPFWAAQGKPGDGSIFVNLDHSLTPEFVVRNNFTATKILKSLQAF